MKKRVKFLTVIMLSMMISVNVTSMAMKSNVSSEYIMVDSVVEPPRSKSAPCTVAIDRSILPMEFVYSDMSEIEEIESAIEALEDTTRDEVVIDLSLNKSVCDYWNEIIEALEKNTSIVSIDLSGCGICEFFGSDAMLQDLLAILETKSKLVSVDLSDNEIQNFDIFIGLLQKTKIQTLVLWGNHLSASIKYFAEALKDNSTLIYLDLADNYLSLQDAEMLADLLENNATLEHLDLSGIRSLSVDGWLYIIESLTKNKTLKVLDLEEIEVQGATDTVIDMLSMRLPNISLQRLSLFKTGLTDFGLSLLRDAVLKKNTLQSLDVRKTFGDGRIFADVHKPGLTVDF